MELVYFIYDASVFVYNKSTPFILWETKLCESFCDSWRWNWDAFQKIWMCRVVCVCRFASTQMQHARRLFIVSGDINHGRIEMTRNTNDIFYRAINHVDCQCTVRGRTAKTLLLLPLFFSLLAQLFPWLGATTAGSIKKEQFHVERRHLAVCVWSIISPLSFQVAACIQRRTILFKQVLVSKNDET